MTSLKDKTLSLDNYKLSEQDEEILSKFRFLIEEYGQSDEKMTQGALEFKKAINEFVLQDYTLTKDVDLVVQQLKDKLEWLKREDNFKYKLVIADIVEEFE